MGVGARPTGPPAQVKGKPATGRQDDQGGTQPEWPRARPEWRAIEDKVAVPGGQELDDLGVGLALAHQVADLSAEVLGEVSPRLGKRLVLADEATQLLGKTVKARLEHRVLGQRSRLAGTGGAPRPRAAEDSKCHGKAR